tara:strand:- start:340 stop:1212 length:873 start_codon:yes stop_codon:yes gene_type:complete
MSILKSKIFFFLLLSSIVFSEDQIDKLIKEVQSGNVQAAIEALPGLKKQQPDNPSVIFLDAMLDGNHERSIKKYKQVYNLYEDSKYADDAIMKIAEFYYTNGSYLKSSEWVKKINLYYSKSDHISRSLDIYIRTLVLTGKEDTARLFMDTFKKKYPNIKLEKHPKLELKEEVADNNKSKETSKPKEKNKILKAVEDIKNKIISPKYDKRDHFSIQIGAYGDYENAGKVRDELIELGFNTRIDIIHLSTKNKDLYAVREGYFRSKEYAKNTQKKIKSRAGYTSIVVDINKY